MIRFILNNREIKTDTRPGTTLLDVIRYERHLTGTKIGCREGDCGACTILVGELTGAGVRYRTATSCLMALGNAHGKHIVTIEGVNGEGLTPVQQAFAAEGATQCGFCTPGFIMSLTWYGITHEAGQPGDAIDAMNGNICRCTGYKSIQRAAGRIEELLSQRGDESPVDFAVRLGLVPGYFSGIPERLRALQASIEPPPAGNDRKLGGGTDLYVQQHEFMQHAGIEFLSLKDQLRFIREEGGEVILGGGVTVTDIEQSVVFRNCFPDLDEYIRLVSSTPIRNMATIAGNFTNASPIGDFSIFFLALDASLVLSGNKGDRVCRLRDFYRGYKQLNKEPDEIISEIRFRKPRAGSLFHFEKVCKRTHLDIASVNTALQVEVKEGRIVSAGLSAGGVAPVPAFLTASSDWLQGRRPEDIDLQELFLLIQSEISPISDARGSADYKRLLLTQLVRAHLNRLFPHVFLNRPLNV